MERSAAQLRRRAWLLRLGVVLLTSPAGADDCVFVAASGIAAVVVVDVGRDRVAGFIPVGEAPLAVAVSADGRRAWVTNHEQHTVSVIDLATRRAVATVPVGDFPADVVVHPDGQRVYVSDRRSHRVSILDAASSQVLGSIGTQGEGPVGMALTRDGRRAFVANSFSNTVAELDLETGRPLGTTAVGAIPYAVALTPDDAHVYVANADSGSVSVLRTSDRAVITTIPVGGNPGGVVVHPKGQFVYAANGPVGSVTVIDTATNTVRTTIEIGSASNTELGGIALAPDGSTAFVSEFILANLFSIDTARDAVTRFTSLGSFRYAPQGLTAIRLVGTCPRSPIPQLTMPASATDTMLYLERADLLPVSGALRIASELIAYEGVHLRQAVRNGRRGQRGTTAAAHADGTPAQLVGEYGDASCDGRMSAADLAALPAQMPDHWRPCGGDLNNDARVTEADLHLLITELFAGI